MNKPSKEIKFLIPLVKKVGDEILKIYEGEFGHELKHDNSPVTKADLLASEMILNALGKKFTHEIISEEHETIITNPNGKIWIVDPIDGTKEFINKSGEFSIMIGLINKGKVILGMIYAPVLGKLYYAEKNKGCYLEENGITKKITVNSTKKLDKFILIKSKYHFTGKDEKILNNLNLNSDSFIKIGSAGIKFGALAEGIGDLSFYTTGKMGIWDDCPSEIILKEAGGDAFDIYGNELVYDLESKKMKYGFVGTNGTNRKKIVSIIKKSLEKNG